MGNEWNVEFISLEVTQYLYFDEAWAIKEFQVVWGVSPSKPDWTWCRWGMGSHVEWPLIDPGVLSHLQLLYPTPLQLEAAFDDEGDCEALVACGFPAIVDEMKMDAVAQLMLWKWDNERPLKRLRLCVAADQLFRLATGDNLTRAGPPPSSKGGLKGGLKAGLKGGLKGS